MGRTKGEKRLLREYLFDNYGITGIEKPNQFKSRFILRGIDDVEIIIKAVKKFYKWDNIYFRGQKCEDWCFSPSISRNKSLIQYENDMLNELYYEEFDFKDIERCRDKIFYAQHYGLPTRMLDVTSKWEVALYFACESFLKHNGENHDSEIILMNVDYEIDKDVEGFFYWQIENSSQLYGGDYIECVKTYSDLLQKDYEKINQKIDEYSTGVRNLYLLTPKNCDGRIKRQCAYGVLLPVFAYKGVFRKHIKSVFRKNMVSIYIPGYLKNEILKELSSRGINKSSLYNKINSREGNFASKCKEIKEKYSNIAKGNSNGITIKN